MLESLVRGNPHARFGGGHTEKYRQIAATRRVPTLPKTACSSLEEAASIEQRTGTTHQGCEKLAEDQREARAAPL